MLENSEIAKILYEIGNYLEMQDVPFKPRAYQKAAGEIENLEGGLVIIYNREGIKSIEKIPSIGKNIAETVEEIIKTAKETNTVLEINAFPDRLDLSDEYKKNALRKT